MSDQRSDQRGNQQRNQTQAIARREPIDLTEYLPSAPVDQISELRDAFRKLSTVANVLTPMVSVDSILPMHQVSLHAVQVNSDPEAKEVYKGSFCEKDERALTRVALDMIEAAAGATRVDAESGRIDDRREPSLYCEFKVTLEITYFDGTTRKATGTESLDLHDGAPEAMKEEWVDEGGRSRKTGRMIPIDPGQLKQKRRKIQRLCETMAQSAALRKLLALKQKYTIKELDKPFVVPKLVSKLDINDPQTKTALLNKALGIVTQVWGPDPNQQQLEPAQDVDDDVKPVDLGEEDYTHVEDDPQQEVQQQQETSEASAPENLEGFGKPTQSSEIHVCGCPCGHQKEIKQAVAEYTIKLAGSKRCPWCWPWHVDFDIAGHREKLGNKSLELKLYPDITVDQAERECLAERQRKAERHD